MLKHDLRSSVTIKLVILGQILHFQTSPYSHRAVFHLMFGTFRTHVSWGFQRKVSHQVVPSISRRVERFNLDESLVVNDGES